MTADQQLLDAALRAWKSNADRAEAFFRPLSEEQLQQEIAPGRNRLLYLLGHLAAVHDAMFPLLGIGPRMHPELDAPFLANADRAVPSPHSADDLRQRLGEIDAALWSAFGRWTPAEFLARHTAVSDEEFRKEPHRNRFSVLLSRTTHVGFHLGQMVLTHPLR